MRTIETLIGSAAVDRIGWALLHSLWQSAVIALGLAVLLRRLHRAPPEARYLAASVALVMMATLPAATSGILSPAEGQVEAVRSVASAPRPGSIGRNVEGHSTPDLPSRPHPAWFPLPGQPGTLLPPLVAAWMLGVLVLTLRFLGGWLVVQRLANHCARPLADPHGAAFVGLTHALRIRRKVRLRQSTLVKVPMVVGCFRPVILLPIAAVTGLTPGQLEALLAHELAHIRRHDYLVNLAQSAIEVLLFYHPAAWWVSRVIRAEREHCCDDLAVRACGDRLTYARALAAMEDLRGGPYLAVAATGGPLLSRVRRILNLEVESMYRLPIFGPGAAVLIGSLLLASAIAQETGPPAQAAGELRSEKRSPLVRDSHGATVYVPTFRSASVPREVQFLLNELVQKEIEKRTPYRVVGHIEEADTILEGTVDFADRNMRVENPLNLPRRLTVSVNWIHNPPLDHEKSRVPTVISKTFDFVPELGEATSHPFFRPCRSLAGQVVKMIGLTTPPADPAAAEMMPGGPNQAVTLHDPADCSSSAVDRETGSADAKAGSRRSTRIFPRDGNQKLFIDTFETKDGDTVTVCHGGVEIVSETVEHGVTSLSADSVVIWRRRNPKASGDAAASPPGERIENAGQPMEMHLEGDVVIQQDKHAIEGKGDQPTYRGKRARYDFRTNQFSGTKD